MPTISLKDAKASFSQVVDQAAAGAFVTITRHGRPAAVLVSPDAAEAMKKGTARSRPSVVDYLRSLPADVDLEDDIFSRNPAPSRDVDL
jgi:prevent-host-death family protein